MKDKNGKDLSRYTNDSGDFDLKKTHYRMYKSGKKMAICGYYDGFFTYDGRYYE
ncbi:KxYKxGKxW signal peptide domain-containing protein [Apilactobacillus ozensis]|uniref:KxYKxGKxW signal peptide domain-containing protein n=1 Tax=Apilactobacillus ozensis TaxID=866801 RepID=UPI00209201CA|nr:KxYKxGKxW signal peptide domain-containing protein [Apilactobacillus ozensis]